MSEAPPSKPDRLDLETLTALQPGLARFMPEIGARFWKAYHAARARNWPLATWQLKEGRKILRACCVTRPKYTADIDAFVEEELDPLMAALAAEDLDGFLQRFQDSVDSANDYHRRWNKPWIVWKVPEDPPADLDLRPRSASES